MRTSYGLLILLALAVPGCADTAPNTEDPQSENETLGSLTLKLSGSDTSGRDYRLRNASFTVTSSPWGFPLPGPFPLPCPDAGMLFPCPGGEPPFSTTVSTETNPDAAEISLRLIPGQYEVSLDSSDWFLERFESGAWAPVEQAVLLSSAYQYAYVYDQSTSFVSFRFGVDGELIDFRAGNLQIGIEIEQPDDEPSWPDGGMVGDSGAPYPFVDASVDFADAGGPYPFVDASVEFPDASAPTAN